MNTNKVARKVRDLQIGDKLIGSGQTVLARPVQGLRTPAGKYEVTVEGRLGKRRTALWNGGTIIHVVPLDTNV